MKGKDKCKILKEIRAQIAAANDIEWVTEHCTHKGDCRGTCPKCEAEVAALEKALERRRALGKSVAVAGLAAGLVVSGSACALMEPNETIGGEMAPPSERVTSVLSTAANPYDEIDGESAPKFYYKDFVLGEMGIYEAKQELYLWGVITDGDDSHYLEGITIPEGTRLQIVGKAEPYQWLIYYENCYYCIWESNLDEYVQAVE